MAQHATPLPTTGNQTIMLQSCSFQEFYNRIAEDVRAIIREELSREYPQVQTDGNDLGLIPRAEACRQLKVTAKTLMNWERIGYIDPVKRGRKVFYRREDLQAVPAKGSKTTNWINL